MTAVLILDDSLTVRMDLADAIEAVGFSVIPCGSVADARAALRDHDIALALLDVRLPDGNGVDLLHEIRRDPATAELPIVMLSSEAEIADRIRGLRMGANDYVGKPYDTSLVIARVRELVRPPAPTRLSVLVIDDSVTFRESLAAALAAAGYAVITAATGTEGLKAAASSRPAAIIVDGAMPDLRGEAVIRRIRLDPALRLTPCLLLTGSEDDDAELRALDAGADAFARKNADIDVVLARFAAVLRGAGDLALAGGSATTRVLVVGTTAALTESIRDDGYDIVVASSGEEALDLIAVQPVDCIVLDTAYVDACPRIKGAPAVRDTPVLVSSENDMRDAMLDALAAGADDFLATSAGEDVLRARIKAQIRRKRLADEQRAVRERLLRAETRAAMAEQLAVANRELAAANRELEAFSYSVSHDLRAPLRAIRSFTQMLEEDAGDKLDEQNRGHLHRVLAATTRMSDLIEALLELARVGRADLNPARVDLSAIAASIAGELRARDPQREVTFAIAPDLHAEGDGRMLRAVLDNLLSNAWKFTAPRTPATIAFEASSGGAFVVRDNGIGFDMKRSDRLFMPFQRLHGTDIPGTGIGLATVRRIVERHGGRVWAESELGRGTAVYFTLRG